MHKDTPLFAAGSFIWSGRETDPLKTKLRIKAKLRAVFAHGSELFLTYGSGLFLTHGSGLFKNIARAV